MRDVSFSLLQKLCLGMVAALFLGAASASLHFSLHAGRTLDQFVATRLAEDQDLRGVELTLDEAWRLYREAGNQPREPLASLLTMDESARERLRVLGDSPAARAVVKALDEARAGLVRIQAVRHEEPSPPAEGTEVHAVLTRQADQVTEALRQARLAGESLSLAHPENRDAVFAVQAGLRELAEAAADYLLDRPDPMPEVIKRLDTVRIALDALAELPQWSEGEERAMLLAFKRTVLLLIGSIPRQEEASPAHASQVGQLWENAQKDIAHFHSTVRARLEEEGLRLEAALERDNRIVLAVTIGGMVGGLAIIVMLQNVLARRVQTLREGASLLADGDLSHRLPPGPKDALGQLALDFNAMAASLEHKEAVIARTVSGLREAQAQLERRVQERTAELRQALEDLRLKDKVFANTREGILVTDRSGLMVEVNPALCELTGYSSQELLGQKPHVLHSPENAGEVEADLLRGLSQDGVWDGEILYRRKDGTDVPLWLMISSLKGEDGQVSHFVGICRDVTAQLKARESITREARHDFLTGLPNRATLMERLEEALRRSRTDGHKLALLFLDLDNFKGVNDSLGHAAGDVLLKHVASRLQACVRGEDMVSRLGGDEFVILATPLRHEEQAVMLSRRILAAFREPFDVGAGTIRTATSIGVSVYPDDGQDAQTLLDNADKALYRAKAQGKGTMEVYTAEIDARLQNRLSAERDLSQDLAQKNVEVHYQPVLLAASPVIIGAEALVRLRRQGQLLAPGLFIPMAEDMNIIQDLTAIVLETVARDFTALSDEGLGGLHVSVNISAQEFAQSAFVERMAASRRQFGAAWEYLGLEITESALMRQPQEAVAIVRALRALGLSVAVDDYGTGYSSLHGLRQFPLSLLKIDRQFVADLDNKGAQAIVRSATSMAKGLGFMVQAEGVETPDQLEFVRRCGCDFYQGHLFSPAVPLAVFREMLLAQREAGRAGALRGIEAVQ